MCSHFEAPSQKRLRAAFGADAGDTKRELWPTYQGPFVRAGDSSEDEGAYDVSVGMFGLLPFWAKDTKLGRRTYNARSETAAQKPSFRSAWKKAQHCIIPAEAIYEPDWRSGKAVATRITRCDGGLMAIAGLWDRWVNESDEEVLSFTMLTVNADDHDLMRNFHKPKDEKRMVVILPNGLINDWLHANDDESMEFMRQYPADRLEAKATL